jgi:predicted transcriptional regulator
MKTTTCEYILWNLLPSIRFEIARSMVDTFGLSQKETASKLDITPAAVCMYLSGKRGKYYINDEAILKEILISAKNIIKDENRDLISETCRICKIARANEISSISNSRRQS